MCVASSCRYNASVVTRSTEKTRTSAATAGPHYVIPSHPTPLHPSLRPAHRRTALLSGSRPVPTTLDTSVPVRRADSKSAPGQESFGAFPRMADGQRVVDESEETRELIGRVRERRRLARRRWVWLGTASAAIGIGIFGATLLFGGVPSRARPGADRSAGTMVAVSAGSQGGNSVPPQIATSSGGENLPAAPPRDNEQGRNVLKPDQYEPGAASPPSLQSKPKQATGSERIEVPAVAPGHAADEDGRS